MSDFGRVGDARVTVVIATYGRPDALVCAVQSVFLQTVSDWKLLIVGDACSAATAEVLAPFLLDPRVRYLNLPWRCGEQALPNSAGMEVASTEYIALLNHDDVWLPRHLEVALQTLTTQRTGLFIGRTVSSAGLDASSGLPDMLGASEVQRLLQSGFWGRYVAVEPASGWVLSRSLASAVGAWRPARELYRTPIEDWALRAWRIGVDLVGNAEVTVLKANEHNLSGIKAALDYETPAAVQRACVEVLADAQRAAVFLRDVQSFADSEAMQVRRRQRRSRALWRGPVSIFINPFTAQLFRLTGFDAFSAWCMLTGEKRGARGRKSLRRRTGESLQQAPDTAQVLDYARAWASGETAW